MSGTREQLRAIFLAVIMVTSVVAFAGVGAASSTSAGSDNTNNIQPGATNVNALNLTIQSDDTVITAGDASAGDPTETFDDEGATTPELFVDDTSEPSSPSSGSYEDGDDVLQLTELTSGDDGYDTNDIHDFAAGSDPSTRFLDDDHDGQYDDGEAILTDDGNDGILSTGQLNSGTDKIITSGSGDLNDFGTGNNFFIDANSPGSDDYNDGEAVLDDVGTTDDSIDEGDNFVFGGSALVHEFSGTVASNSLNVFVTGSDATLDSGEILYVEDDGTNPDGSDSSDSEYNAGEDVAITTQGSPDIASDVTGSVTQLTSGATTNVAFLDVDDDNTFDFSTDTNSDPVVIFSSDSDISDGDAVSTSTTISPPTEDDGTAIEIGDTYQTGSEYVDIDGASVGENGEDLHFADSGSGTDGALDTGEMIVEDRGTDGTTLSSSDDVITAAASSSDLDLATFQQGSSGNSQATMFVDDGGSNDGTYEDGDDILRVDRTTPGSNNVDLDGKTLNEFGSSVLYVDTGTSGDYDDGETIYQEGDGGATDGTANFGDTVNAITVENDGTLSASNINSISLFKNSDGDNTLSSGEIVETETSVNGVTGRFEFADQSATVGPNPTEFVFTVDLSNSAPTGETVALRVPGANDVNSNGFSSGSGDTGVFYNQDTSGEDGDFSNSARQVAAGSLSGPSNGQISLTSQATLTTGVANATPGLIQIQDDTTDAVLSGETTITLPDGLTVNESASQLTTTKVTATGDLSVTSVSVENNGKDIIIGHGQTESSNGDKIRIADGALKLEVDGDQFDTSDSPTDLPVDISYSLGSFSGANLFAGDHPDKDINGAAKSLAVNTPDQNLAADLEIDDVDQNELGAGTSIVVTTQQNTGVTFDKSVDVTDAANPVIEESGGSGGTGVLDIDGDGTREINISAATVSDNTLTVPINNSISTGSDHELDIETGSDLAFNTSGTANSAADINVSVAARQPNTGSYQLGGTDSATFDDVISGIDSPVLNLGSDTTIDVGANDQSPGENLVVDLETGVSEKSFINITTNNSAVTFDTSTDFSNNDPTADTGFSVDQLPTDELNVTVTQDTLAIGVDEDGGTFGGTDGDEIKINFGSSNYNLNVSNAPADGTTVQFNATNGPVQFVDSDDFLDLQRPDPEFNGASGNASLTIDNNGVQGVEVDGDDLNAFTVEADGLGNQLGAGTNVTVNLESDTGVSFDQRETINKNTNGPSNDNIDVFEGSDTDTRVDDDGISAVTLNDKSIEIELNSDNGVASSNFIVIDELFLNGTAGASNTTVSVVTNSSDAEVTTETANIIETDTASPDNVFGDADISDGEAGEGEGPTGEYGVTGDAAADTGNDGPTVGDTTTGSVFVRNGGPFGDATVNLELVDQPSGSSFSTAEVLNTTQLTTADDGTADFEFEALSSAEIGAYTINASTSEGGVNMTYEVQSGQASQFDVTGVNNSVIDQSGLSGTAGENETAAFKVRIEDSGGNLVSDQDVDVNVQISNAELQDVTADISDDGSSNINNDDTAVVDTNSNDRRNYDPDDEHDDDPTKGDFYVFASSTTPGDINVTISEGGISDTGTATVFDAIDTVEIDANKTTATPGGTIGVTATAVTSDGTTVEVPRNPLNDFSSDNTTVLQRASLSEEATDGTFANGTVEATFDATGLGTANVNVSIAGGDGSVPITVETATANFDVSNVTPDGDTVTTGDNITVTADVENTGTASGTQTVEFRLDTDQNGTLETDEELRNKTVSLDVGNSTTVTFENVSTDDLTAGDFTHGVFSEDDSATATITVEAEPEPSVSVNFTDQTVANGTEEVTVDSANFTRANGSAGDYVVVVHTIDEFGAPVGNVSNATGASGDLTGAEENITVDLTAADGPIDSIAEDVTLRAMLHTTANDSAFGTRLGAEIDGIELGDETDDANITVEEAAPESADFAVSNVTPDGVNVTAGDNITVSADIENVGGQQATQSVEFRIVATDGDTSINNASATATQDVTLDAGANDTVTFENVSTDGLTAGDFTHGVFSENDSATATITIEEAAEDAPANFEVSDLEPQNATVNVSEAFDVSATVENTGDLQGEQEIELRLEPDGDAVRNQTVSLDAGNSTTVTFDNVTVDTAGEFNHTVASANDSATGSLTVEQREQEQEPPTATVTFENQTVQNGSTTVNVASATFNGSEAFNIVVHQASDDNDDGTIQASEIGQKIGESEALEPGSEPRTNVSVNISKQVADNDNVSQLTANQTLVAMLHTTNTSDDDSIVHTASIKRDGTPVFDQADIGIEPESPLDGPAARFDENANGDISITELGQAGREFAAGDLSITELGQVGRVFAR